MFAPDAYKAVEWCNRSQDRVRALERALTGTGIGEYLQWLDSQGSLNYFYTFRDRAVSEYGFDAAFLSRLLTESKTRFYLTSFTATLAATFGSWGVCELGLPEAYCDDILTAFIPAVAGTRITDLASEHNDTRFSGYADPLMAMFKREMERQFPLGTFGPRWAILEAQYAAAEQAEASVRWTIPHVQFYSDDLLGNKGITLGIIGLAMLERSERRRNAADEYLQLLRHLNAAAQLVDDADDWEEDLVVGRVSLPLRNALVAVGITVPDIKASLLQHGDELPRVGDELRQRIRGSLWASDVTEANLDRIERSYKAAYAVASELGDTFWKLLVRLRLRMLELKRVKWVATAQAMFDSASLGRARPIRKGSS